MQTHNSEKKPESENKITVYTVQVLIYKRAILRKMSELRENSELRVN